MSSTWSSLIHTFADRHVGVIGEAMLDSYLIGSADRLCQEAPVPVVTLSDRCDRPGGAANVAVNLHDLGARVSFLSVIGDDVEGVLLQQALERRGISTDPLIMERSRQTLVKKRVMAASQMLLRIDSGETAAIAPDIEQQFIQRLNSLISNCDALVISDYNYGLLTPAVIAAIATLQATSPKLLVVDSKRLASYQSLGVTVVKPNYDEAARLLANSSVRSDVETETRIEFVVRHRDRLLDLTGANIVIVTLDVEGALILQRHQLPQRIEAKPTVCRQTAGAGDTFISALTLALASQATVAIAAELAVTAAAVVIAKAGTATCSIEELQTASTALPKPQTPALANSVLGKGSTESDLFKQEVV